MVQNYLKKSLVDSVDFMLNEYRAFCLFVLSYILCGFFLAPQIVLPFIHWNNESSLIGIFSIFTGLILMSWHVVSVWLYVWRTGEREKEQKIRDTFVEAIFDTPSYFMYSLLYCIIILLSLLCFIVPVFIMGPVFFFLPQVGFMELKKANESVFRATRRLTRGRFWSLLLFFILLICEQIFFSTLEALVQSNFMVGLAQLGFFCWAVFGVFTTVWGAKFLKECYEDSTHHHAL